MKIGTSEISGYTVESIIISDSYFSLDKSFSGDKSNAEVDVDIKIERNITESVAKCWLTVETKILDKSKTNVIADLNVTAIGIFEKRIEDPKIAIADFAKLNAIAIMYPFVREHVASMSLKSGLDVIMLPSVNFVALMKSEDERQRGIND